MKSFKKLIKYFSWFIRCIYESLLWLVRLIEKGSFHNYIKDNKTGRLVVVGNGPSVADSMQDVINCTTCCYCCVNHAAKTPFFYQIKPQYYVLVDMLFFSERKNKKDQDTINMLKSVDWNMKLFVPYRCCDIVRKEFKNNRNISILPFNPIPYKGFRTVKHYLYNRGLSMPLCNNVMIAALFIGVQLGYEKIDVYGLDFSWIKEMRVDENNVVCRVDKHFYEQEVQLTPWVKSDGTPFTVSSICRTLADGLDSFRDVAEYAQRKGCLIINRNKSSFIDCFVKKEIEV